jgi:hypothetical protein
MRLYYEVLKDLIGFATLAAAIRLLLLLAS